MGRAPRCPAPTPTHSRKRTAKQNATGAQAGRRQAAGRAHRLTTTTSRLVAGKHASHQGRRPSTGRPQVCLQGLEVIMEAKGSPSSKKGRVKEGEKGKLGSSRTSEHDHRPYRLLPYRHRATRARGRTTRAHRNSRKANRCRAHRHTSFRAPCTYS